MRFIKNKKIIVFLVLLGVFAAKETALARELATTWPASPLGTSLDANSELPHFVQYLYEWGISLGGLAVFIALLIAGFQYLSSAGNPTMMKDARDRIVSALLGLGLLLGSWLILNTINPQFTVLQLPTFDPGTPPDLKETIEKVEEDSKEMGEILVEGDMCTSATIVSEEGIEFVFTPDPSDCVAFGADYISTDGVYTIQGYVGGEPRPCVGTLVLFAADKCNTDVDGYELITPRVNMPITATDAQHGRLDVPNLSISIWDILLPWR